MAENEGGNWGCNFLLLGGCPRKIGSMASKWVVNVVTYLYINGVNWGYNPLTNHLLTSWDILVGAHLAWGL